MLSVVSNHTYGDSLDPSMYCLSQVHHRSSQRYPDLKTDSWEMIPWCGKLQYMYAQQTFLLSVTCWKQTCSIAFEQCWNRCAIVWRAVRDTCDRRLATSTRTARLTFCISLCTASGRDPAICETPRRPSTFDSLCQWIGVMSSIVQLVSSSFDGNYPYDNLMKKSLT